MILASSQAMATSSKEKAPNPGAFFVGDGGGKTTTRVPYIYPSI